MNEFKEADLSQQEKMAVKKNVFMGALNDELAKMEQTGRLLPAQAEEKRKAADLIDHGFSDDPTRDALIFSRSGVADEEEMIKIFNNSSSGNVENIEKLSISEVEGEISGKPQNEAKKFRIMGATKDANFEGSTIIKTEDEEGRVVGYAIRKNREGGFEGSKIGYMPDGSIGATYQLHDSDFENLRQMGILDSYEGALANESLEKINEAQLSMLRLYNEGDRFNPWEGRWPADELMSPAEKALDGMSSDDQEKVAIGFFNATIGTSIANNKKAYPVYGVFSKTPFGQKFRQLEDKRLKAAGYAGFKL